MGLVSNGGVANSLRVKLRHAQSEILSQREQSAYGAIGAFINEVDAQRGKNIETDAADDLITFAMFIRGTIAPP
jgi:hypothetical protein